jgi:hypothetical protein
MKITARVVKVLQIESGTGKNGNEWKKQSILVTQLDNDFKEELLLDMWNDNIKEFEEGTAYKFEISLKSREWNGKYFTNVTCKAAYSIHSVSDENPFE